MINTSPRNHNPSTGLSVGERAGAPAGAARTFATLLAAGDVQAIYRRLYARSVGRPPLLPQALEPLVTPKGPERAAARVGERRAIMMSPSLGLTGAPISQAELAAGLAARGWTLTVWTKSDGPTRRLYDEAGLTLRVEPLLEIAQSTPAAYERGVEALATLISKAGAPLVYANTIDMFPAIDAARRAGAPSIWNIRESEPWRQRLADRHVHVAARALAALSYPESVVFVADAAARAWRAFTQGDARVIYNAPHPRLLQTRDRIAARKRLGARDGTFIFLAVGTLCARKGQRDIARALADIDGSVLEQIEVVLVGDAEADYARLFERSLSPRTAAHIRRLGPIEDPSDLFVGADALLNTSRSEAFPRTFIEAAAAGLPILATDVDGAGERLKDEASALFYAPGDALHLSAQMSRLATDAAIRRRLVDGARSALVTSWTFDDMISAYDAAFAQAATAR